MLQVDGREIKRWPPHPLATLDMQKTAIRVLRMPGTSLITWWLTIVSRVPPTAPKHDKSTMQES